MRIGAFEISEPLPELKETHALAMLRPWVDVGSVGGLVLRQLEVRFGAREMGRLAKPGSFFDFTRYRPLSYYQGGKRQLGIPNSVIHYAKREGQNDFLFLHLLEPHTLGEEYVDSIMSLLKYFNVKRYCLLGSMYDMVPHTRPLIVTGGGVGKDVEAALNKVGIQPGRYEGPTTIVSLVPQQAAALGMETMSLIVHLPQYTDLEEDYTGEVRLMELLGEIYDLPPDEAEIRKAEQQLKQIDGVVLGNPQIKGIMAQLEAHYDDRTAKGKKEDQANLSPEVEKFLKEMDKRFGQS